MLNLKHADLGVHRVASGDHEMTVLFPADRPVHQVLYLLDGNAAIDALQSEWLKNQAHLALVAIGYVGAETFDLDRRSLDYTPTPPKNWDGGPRRALDRPHGGANQFLKRLCGDIIPMVEEQLNLSQPRRALWGHSYGGLFAFWALMQHKKVFDAVHAASPSLWWGDYMLEKQILSGDIEPDISTQVTLSMGDGEISRTGERLYTPERLRVLAETLRSSHELDCRVHIFQGASHGATFAKSLGTAIRTI